jgi:hypothetical protein
VVVGESAVTAAPFFSSAGRPSQPFWGPQQDNKLVLWESLDEEEQANCWNALEQKKRWVVWCRANPGKMGRGRQAFKQCGRGERVQSRLVKQLGRDIRISVIQG